MQRALYDTQVFFENIVFFYIRFPLYIKKISKPLQHKEGEGVAEK